MGCCAYVFIRDGRSKLNVAKEVGLVRRGPVHVQLSGLALMVSRRHGSVGLLPQCCVVPWVFVECFRVDSGVLRQAYGRE